MRYYILQTLLILILTSSCKTDKVSHEKLVGNWITFETQNSLTDELIEQRLIFNKEGGFIDADDVEHYDIFGKWKIEGRKLIVDYIKGTGTEYFIESVNDTILILIEDKGDAIEQTLKFRRTPFKKDTLKTGTYYLDSNVRDFPNLIFIDSDTNEGIEEFTDGSEQFIWIKSDRLTHYKLDLILEPNGILRKTATRGLYELNVKKSDSNEYLDFVGQFSFKGDSVFILERNWTDLSKSKYSDSIYLYDGIIKGKLHRR
jgi:hypothetical protein